MFWGFITELPSSAVPPFKSTCSNDPHQKCSRLALRKDIKIVINRIPHCWIFTWELWALLKKSGHHFVSKEYCSLKVHDMIVWLCPSEKVILKVARRDPSGNGPAFKACKSPCKSSTEGENTDHIHASFFSGTAKLCCSIRFTRARAGGIGGKQKAVSICCHTYDLHNSMSQRMPYAIFLGLCRGVRCICTLIVSPRNDRT